MRKLKFTISDEGKSFSPTEQKLFTRASAIDEATMYLIHLIETQEPKNHLQIFWEPIHQTF